MSQMLNRILQEREGEGRERENTTRDSHVGKICVVPRGSRA